MGPGWKRLVGGLAARPEPDLRQVAIRIVETVRRLEADLEVVMRAIDDGERDLRGQVYAKQREIRALREQMARHAELAEFAQGLEAWLRETNPTR